MRKCFEYYILDGLLSGLFNYASNQETNAENRNQAKLDREWQERMLDKQNVYNAQQAQIARAYNTSERVAQENFIKSQNQTLFDREDTAHRRAVVDAVEAGLSPLAVVGSGAQASLVSGAPSGSGISSASSASVPNPASYRAQSTVMNMDMSSLIGAMMDNEKNKIQREKNKSDRQLAEAELEMRADIENKKLLQQGSQFAEMQKMEEDHFLKSFAQSAEQFSAQTAQQQLFHYDDLSDRDKQREFENIQSNNKIYADMARSMADSAGIPVVYYPVTTIDDYNRGISAVSKYLSVGNSTVVSDWKNDAFKSSENKQGNLSGSVAGVASGSVGGSVGENRENVSKEAIKNAYIHNGVLRVPILVRDYKEWDKDFSYLNEKLNKNNKDKKSAPNRYITEFGPSGKNNVYNPFIKSKVWSKK